MKRVMFFAALLAAPVAIGAEAPDPCSDARAEVRRACSPSGTFEECREAWKKLRDCDSPGTAAIDAPMSVAP